MLVLWAKKKTAEVAETSAVLGDRLVLPCA